MKKQTYSIFVLFLLLLPITFALTLEEYVDNLDTSFYDGTINIINFIDKMVDTDLNNQNNTLIFTLTTDYATSDIFTANIFFEDESLPVLSDTRLISSSNPSFYMNISTFYLTKAKYAYYVRIYNQIGQVVYESKKINTSVYNNYETGTTIIKITDENLNNNFIRINLTLDVKRNEKVNISVNLNYDGKTISGIKEVTLTAPTQIVSIDIDDETLKSTHYKGMYNISSIIIGSKVIEIEQITSYYDYEVFAKTSYIKNISSYYLDTNADNLIDYLIIDFIINSKEASTYGIYYDLYDEFGNFVTSIAKTQSLGTGIGIISTNISGQDLYKTKINGPYLIATVRLDKSDKTVDTLYYPHLTDISYYSDFERPPLPDLNTSIDVYYTGSANLIKVTVANTGEVPAFNIFVDVFNDESYYGQKSYSVLDVSESHIFNFIADNTKNNSIFTAIVDFDNLIEESDETDNIKTTYFVCVDADADGYNLTGGECGPVDCDDNNPNIYPGITELCNNIDDNCNNQIDENLTITFGTDVGACESGIKTCINGNYTITKEEIEPKEEVCNNMDDNCDGQIDEGCPVDEESALENKENALEILQSLEADKKSKKELNKAIKELTKSLGNKIEGGDKKITWIDGTHIACKGGHKVFDKEKKVVEHLEKIKDQPIISSVDETIALIVNADKILAETAISEAEDSKDKDKAIKKLEKAETKKKDKNKINEYKKAWKYINKHCEKDKKKKQSCIEEITIQSSAGEEVTAIGDEIGHPNTVFTDSEENNVKIHTSCSRCIEVGDVKDGWTITEIVDDGTLATKCGE